MQTTARIDAELFRIDNNGRQSWGANQIWLPTEFKRRAGCGPTVGAHLMWYLARTQQGMARLCPYDAHTRAGAVELMLEMWEYITPGRRGVNSPDIFFNGAMRYAGDRCVPLTYTCLEIAPIHCKRPTPQEVCAFLSAALEGGLPVAFLNLSNGALTNLDNWHWVTVIAVDAAARTGTIIDQSKLFDINLDLWVRSTLAGGAFVTLERAEWFSHFVPAR